MSVSYISNEFSIFANGKFFFHTSRHTTVRKDFFVDYLINYAESELYDDVFFMRLNEIFNRTVSGKGFTFYLTFMSGICILDFCDFSHNLEFNDEITKSKNMEQSDFHIRIDFYFLFTKEMFSFSNFGGEDMEDFLSKCERHLQ